MSNEFARHLRKSSTDAERKLWYFLRNRLFSKYKFRRQYAIGNYIVDFICLHRKLIIELDGSQHFDQKDYDDQRTVYLKNRGFHLLRFWNNDIFQNIEGVMEEITTALMTNPHPVPLPEKVRSNK